MSWFLTEIGEHCEITSSKRIFYSEYVKFGIPFYRSKEIIEKSQGQNISEPLYISEEKYEEIKKKFGVPVPGDMLLTSVGTIGIPYIVKENSKFYFKDGNLTWFRHFDNQLSSKFLLYWIQSDDGKGILYNSTIGSSQKALTISCLKKIKMPLPPIEIQNKIASILSAYDDLIENNRRQIKLLKEAAQRLYKEWFVDLRFPGHESVKIIDDVPEGWRVGTIGEIVEFRRGKTITKAQVVNGNVPVVAGGLEPAYYHNKANTTAPVITVSASGNAGFTKLYLENVFASDCSFAEITQTPHLYFVFCFLKANSMQLKLLQRGTAQQHVYAKDINSLKLSIPDMIIIDKFCEYTREYFSLIGKRQQQIKYASEARDRLLPKLMSGEIDVSERIIDQ